jgi:putative heme-binding domain-containing protein
VSLRLQFSVKVSEMMAVGVRPTRGDFALPDADIIKPGDPCASTLFFRMAKFGRDRMPHLGSEEPDEAGLQLIAEWIAGMDGAQESADLTLASAPADQMLSQPQAALQIARRLALGKLSGVDRDAVLSAAASLPAGPIRDLFEGYLPPGERGERKLGTNPRPGTILALNGDAGRGETLFWSEAVRCGSCHRIGERGTPVGPDLSAIGSLRSRADLLESLLEPSRRIEPKYAAYTALTSSGLLATGLLVARDENSVVLRDAQNKQNEIPASDVEQLQPSRTSLMPDGQMAGLTALEAADLLEYLATRK